ncbi:hypothetical protein PUN28_015516 [Cardiocondyla obscurior]|uniref:Secreted protein n=1 Tax=Cardiocondyla obscurior TaxID=286306 RepID=A0AAW2EX04_9HYME
MSARTRATRANLASLFAATSSSRGPCCSYRLTRPFCIHRIRRLHISIPFYTRRLYRVRNKRLHSDRRRVRIIKKRKLVSRISI